MARFGFMTLVILAALAALTSCGGGDGGGETSHIVSEYDPRVLNDMAVDDLDGDERVDLVLARSPYGSEILTSSSTREVSARSFTSISFFAEGYGQAVAVADIDGDGKKDIAVAEDESVHLLLQTPSGSFVEHSTLSYTAFVGSLSMADLDHDGRNDLVVGLWPTVFAPVVGSGLLVQFQRKEAATFEPPVELPTLSAQHILCDVDGDGWGDVLAAGRGTEAVVVFRQDPGNPRSFFPGHPVALGEPSASLATGDFDDDGRLDVAFTRNVSRRLWICLQDPGAPGAFGPPVALHVPRKVVSVVSGDLNGDGATDLLAGISRRGVSLVLLRDPRSPATFQRAQRVKARHECRRVGIADLDGDARLDLVCAGDTRVSVFEQRGARPLKFHQRLLSP